MDLILKISDEDFSDLYTSAEEIVDSMVNSDQENNILCRSLRLDTDQAAAADKLRPGFAKDLADFGNFLYLVHNELKKKKEDASASLKAPLSLHNSNGINM